MHRSKNLKDRRVSLSAAPLPYTGLAVESKIVIVLVGLPARGKTYISKRLTRYLNWVGISCKVFNLGDYRRQVTNEKSHEFFDPNNEQAITIRKEAACEAMEDLMQWMLEMDGEVAVFDATNSTRERRQWVLDQCQPYNFTVIFVESVCFNQKTIQENIREVKVSSPDYVGMDAEIAAEDFKKRIAQYEKTYEPMDEVRDRHLSFIKIIEQGEKYIVNRIKGTIPSRIVYFLMNIRVGKRTIYLTRHGESVLNEQGRIGGDSDLSEAGLVFRDQLAEFVEKENVPDLRVWTSHFKRTIQTAEKITCQRLEHWKALNEIDAGVCEEMTYEEIEQKFPNDFRKRDEDKYHYRYPMGESYQDLVARLEPVIMELERQRNVLVICHQAVARCLLAYFEDKTKEELPYLKVPLHTVVKLTPTAYRCKREEFALCLPGVNTHREKPEGTPNQSQSDTSLIVNMSVHQDVVCKIANIGKKQKQQQNLHPLPPVMATQPQTTGSSSSSPPVLSPVP